MADHGAGSMGGGLAIYGTSAVRRGANELMRVSINTFRRPLTRLMRIVLNKPVLSAKINRFLLRYPSLHQRLLGIAQQGGVIPGAPSYRPPSARNTNSWQQVTPSEFSQLTPRARRIYYGFKTAIDDRRKEDG